jgi:hypothetical protein
MLVCAVLAALAAGVLVAYGVCLGMFGLFRMHAKQHFVPFSTLRVKAEAEPLRD